MTFVEMKWDLDLAERARINYQEFDAEARRVASVVDGPRWNGKLQILSDDGCELIREQMRRDDRRFWVRWGLVTALCAVLYLALLWGL